MNVIALCSLVLLYVMMLLSGTKRTSLTAMAQKHINWSLTFLVVLTLGQLQVECVVNFLNVSASLDAPQLIPELPQLDVEVDFVLSSRELSTTSAGRRHQIQSLRRRTDGQFKAEFNHC